MERSSKIQKRVSLSLGNKLQKKRHSASPQSRLRAGAGAACTTSIDVEIAANCANAAAAAETMTTNAASRSPSVISFSSECCTPPPRKSISLDDSVDFSPKLLDSSLSPSCLFSQTMITDSPEVDWRWNRRRAIEKATAAQKIKNGKSSDSGFNSEENLQKTTDTGEGHERRKLILTCNEKRRTVQEQQMRRAQQTRAHELLQERCERLHKQLEVVKVRSAEKIPKATTTTTTTEETGYTLRSSSAKKESTASCALNNLEVARFPITEKLSEVERPTNTLDDFFNDSDIDCFMLDANDVTPTKVSKMPAPVELVKPQPTQTTATLKEVEASKQKSNTLDDFFNDSDSDDFLLEATQQLETQIVTLTTQQVASKTAPAAKATSSTSKPTTSKTKQQQQQQQHDKRSSLYMKFLEEETPDEWLTAFDEAEREATQPKKLRTSLQRYKSMPHTTTASNATLTSATEPASTMANNVGASATTVTTPISFKRHASTHALSPVARNKLFGNSK